MVGLLHVGPPSDYPEIIDIEWSVLGIEWKVSASSNDAASIGAQSLAALFQINIVEVAQEVDRPPADLVGGLGCSDDGNERFADQWSCFRPVERG